MAEYRAKRGNLFLTLMVGSQLTRVKFVNGVFSTEDPMIRVALEKSEAFNKDFTRTDEKPLTGPERSAKVRRGIPQHYSDLSLVREALANPDTGDDPEQPVDPRGGTEPITKPKGKKK